MIEQATERLYRGMSDDLLRQMLQAFRSDRAREWADPGSVAFINGRIHLIERELRKRGLDRDASPNI